MSAGGGRWLEGGWEWGGVVHGCRITHGGPAQGRAGPAACPRVAALLPFFPRSNAANALSEDSSLLQVPVWRNPWLLVAMSLSLGLHALIL